MDEIQRFQKIQEEINTLSNRKIRLEERFNDKKSCLEKLLIEITEKGYDPKKLTDIKKEKEELLKKQLKELESLIQETQEKLNLIEV